MSYYFLLWVHWTMWELIFSPLHMQNSLGFSVCFVHGRTRIFGLLLYFSNTHLNCLWLVFKKWFPGSLFTCILHPPFLFVNLDNSYPYPVFGFHKFWSRKHCCLATGERAPLFYGTLQKSWSEPPHTYSSNDHRYSFLCRTTDGLYNFVYL